MKIKNTIILLFVALFAGFIHPQASFAKWGSSGLTLEFSSGYSGDSYASGCGSSACHTGRSNNTGGGSVSVAVKSGGSTVTSYTGGQTYTVEVTIAHSGLSRWGFQTTAKKGSTNTAAGTFATSDSTTEINLYSSALSTNDYIQSAGSDSNLAGAKDGTANSATYSFTWTAPAAGTGTVTFYAAGVAADGDGSGETDTGDFPYTTTATLTEGSATTPTAPTIDIKVNGSDGPVTYTGTLSVSVSLTAGSVSGTNGDWFVAAAYGSTWYYYHLTSGWQAGLNATHQGALGDLPTYTFPTLTATLPSGTYTLYFAVDTNMNGSPDTSSSGFYYDTVTMTVP